MRADGFSSAYGCDNFVFPFGRGGFRDRGIRSENPSIIARATAGANAVSAICCAIVHGVSADVIGIAATPLDSRLVDELAAIVGRDGIVSRPSELKVYECDGWTVEKNSPDLLVMPRTTEQVSAVLKALWRRGLPFVPRGAGKCAGDDLHLEDESYSGDRSRQPPGRGRKRSRQSACHQRHQAGRLFLCAGPFLATGLHDRRQYRRKLRRTAHPQIRRHHQSCDGPDSRAG